MKELLKVEGMSCGHCVKAVEGNVGWFKFLVPIMGLLNN